MNLFLFAILLHWISIFSSVGPFSPRRPLIKSKVERNFLQHFVLSSTLTHLGVSDDMHVAILTEEKLPRYCKRMMAIWCGKDI